MGDLATWAGVAVALAVAFVGWIQAWRARSTSTKAGQRAARAEHRADEALELARSAEERADRLEQIAGERRDVQWKRKDTNRDDVVSFTNVGTDTAYDVELMVDIDGNPRQSSTFPSVGPTDGVGIYLNHIVEEAKTEQRLALERAGIAGIAVVEARARITWRSELGVRCVADIGEITL